MKYKTKTITTSENLTCHDTTRPRNNLTWHDTTRPRNNLTSHATSRPRNNLTLHATTHATSRPRNNLIWHARETMDVSRLTNASQMSLRFLYSLSWLVEIDSADFMADNALHHSCTLSTMESTWEEVKKGVGLD